MKKPLLVLSAVLLMNSAVLADPPMDSTPPDDRPQVISVAALPSVVVRSVSEVKAGLFLAEAEQYLDHDNLVYRIVGRSAGQRWVFKVRADGEMLSARKDHPGDD